MSEAAQRFAAPATAAVLAVGIAGVLIPGLQPQLLGALAHEGAVTLPEIGTLATAELLAMGVAAAAAGFLLPVTRLRATAAAALIMVALLDFLTPGLRGTALLAVRAGAGIGEGVLVWLAIGLIVRSASAARWSGIYLMTQTLAQFGIASLLGLLVIPVFGAEGGFRVLALATLIALFALPWLPRAYAPLVGDDRTGMPPARGLLALLGVFLYLGFVVAVWVYIEPLGSQRGLDAATLAVVAPLSLGMQVVGGALAALLADRLPPRRVLLGVALANLALLGVMATAATPVVFVVATAAFGLLWLFAMPFQVPLVIAADPSRRAAVLIGGAQLVGSSLGPFAASLLVAETDVEPVLWFGAAALVAAVAALLLAARGKR